MSQQLEVGKILICGLRKSPCIILNNIFWYIFSENYFYFRYGPRFYGLIRPLLIKALKQLYCDNF